MSMSLLCGPAQAEDYDCKAGAILVQKYFSWVGSMYSYDQQPYNNPAARTYIGAKWNANKAAGSAPWGAILTQSYHVNKPNVMQTWIDLDGNAWIPGRNNIGFIDWLYCKA
jgi:hypothetical protein